MWWLTWALKAAKPAFWVAIAALLAALVGVWWHGYATGKSAERTAQEVRMAQALVRAAQEAQRIRDQDIALMMEARDRETRIIERIREVRVDVPTPDCRDLGTDWVREANRAIAAARDSGGADD